MGRGLASYSDKDFRDALTLILNDITAPSMVYPVDEPQAVLLGGQSGAGKTALHHLLSEGFSRNVAIVKLTASTIRSSMSYRKPMVMRR